MPISLIANTGIQFYKTHIQFDWNEIRSRFHFHQYWNRSERRLSLEVAQQFSDAMTGDFIYVSKSDLKARGLLDANDKYVGTWNDDADIRRFNDTNIIEVKASTLQKPILKGEQPVLSKFFNQWLPFPCFEKNLAGRLQEGPYNWARIMVTPKGFNPTSPEDYDYSDSQDWDITVAFDTASVFDDGNYTNEFRESPLFANHFERKKTFGVPVTDLMLMNFVAPPKGNCDWIDAGILNLVHNTSDINMLYKMFPKNNDETNEVTMPPVYTYLSSYLYFLHIIADRFARTEVELVNAEQVAPINVDLVVDMGNSKTTAVLFEEGRFDKVDMVELQDFSHPFQSEKSPFDMNVVFNRADFGICNIGNSTQFIHPSLVRLGREATYLRYQAGLERGQKFSTCSSPKRYLWDKHPRPYEWQNIRHGNDEPEPIKLDGITNQFNSDGTLSETGRSGGEIRYSRRSLMTLAFLEILAQSYRQINSQQFRKDKGAVDTPRRISKILVTCPTAMSRREQIELRTAAGEAYTVLNRYYNHTDNTPLNYHVAINSAPVKPSLRELNDRNDGSRKWLYDEATCVQFVYLCAEVVKRYNNNCAEFFERYGKFRSDIFEANGKTPYTKKSLTVGSVDIGAGTTDVMICTYKYATVGQTTLTPVPRYWESFYIAGDDILKAFVQEIVIEGKNAMVESKLSGKARHIITTLITDFFGEDTNRISFPDRQIRREFCQQISVPIAQFFMECTRRRIDKLDLKWDDIFKGQDKPNQELLDSFYDHFGFRIEEQVWHYDIKVTTKIIESVMDGLLKKISVALAEYGCDIVLLAGRPCSLSPIEEIFLKYYPVTPNRLKVLNDYRVGRWYPFQDGNGFFENQKSVVAVGALIGYICSELGGYDGMSFNFEELGQKMLPTTDYIGLMSNKASALIPQKDILLDPKKNIITFDVPSIPIRLGCRQLDSESYPARSLYTLDFDDDAIREVVKSEFKQKGFPVDNLALIQDSVDTRKMRIRQSMPVKLEIERDYDADRETVVVTDVTDKDDNKLPKRYLSLQIKSLSESDTFWLDNGEFRCNISSKG